MSSGRIWFSAILRVNAFEEVKMKFDGPATNPHAFNPGTSAVRLVADHKVDALLNKDRARLLDNRCRVFRCGKTIDDRAQSHIAKMAVVAEPRIQQKCPANRLLSPQNLDFLQTIGLARIHPSEGRRIAERAHAVVLPGRRPDFIAPRLEISCRFGSYGLVETASLETKQFPAIARDPADTRESQQVQYGSAKPPVAQVDDISQEVERVDNMEEERHGKHLPAGGLQEPGHRFIKSAHSQSVQKRLSLNRIEQEPGRDLGVRPIDNPFRDRKHEVSDINNLARQPERLKLQGIGAAYAGNAVRTGLGTSSTAR